MQFLLSTMDLQPITPRSGRSTIKGKLVDQFNLHDEITLESLIERKMSAEYVLVYFLYDIDDALEVGSPGIKTSIESIVGVVEHDNKVLAVSFKEFSGRVFTLEALC